MDSVPTTFCDSVCMFLEDELLGDFAKLWESDCRIWKAAVREKLETRVKISVGFSCSRGVWTYSLRIYGLFEFISFEELKRINRRHLLVGTVSIGFCPTFDLQTSSLEEIWAISNYTFPFLCKSTLTLHRNSEFPMEALSSLLARYRRASFSSIQVMDHQQLVDNFVKVQLQTNDALLNLTLFEKCSRETLEFSDEVRFAVEEFAICKPFKSVFSLSITLKLGKAFFERLFEKTMNGSMCDFFGHFSFEFEELKGFRTEIQDEAAASLLSAEEGGEAKYEYVIWRRPHGGKVTVRSGQNETWWIKVEG